MATKIN